MNGSCPKCFCCFLSYILVHYPEVSLGQRNLFVLAQCCGKCAVNHVCQHTGLMKAAALGLVCAADDRR